MGVSFGHVFLRLGSFDHLGNGRMLGAILELVSLVSLRITLIIALLLLLLLWVLLRVVVALLISPFIRLLVLCSLLLLIILKIFLVLLWVLLVVFLPLLLGHLLLLLLRIHVVGGCICIFTHLVIGLGCRRSTASGIRVVLEHWILRKRVVAIIVVLWEGRNNRNFEFRGMSTFCNTKNKTQQGPNLRTIRTFCSHRKDPPARVVRLAL